MTALHSAAYFSARLAGEVCLSVARRIGKPHHN